MSTRMGTTGLGVSLLTVATAFLLTTGCVTHPKGPHGPACTTVEAASAISLSSDRQQALAKIAAKPNLSQHEQEYLVSVATVTGGTADDVARTLIALVQNPCCTADTRQYISKQLACLGTSSARKRVVDAMIDTQPSE